MSAAPQPPTTFPSQSELQATKRSDLLTFARSVFHSPDEVGIDAILATYRTHFFDSTKPVWLWIVGLSGSGKGEIGIRVCEGLPLFYPVSEVSTKAFVTAKAGSKGILQRLPPSHPGIPDSRKRHGVLVFKDFTTFLSMRADDRAAVAGQLREIADGSWSRSTGESGTKLWEGKVTMIAACTPELEHAWATLRKMGDRFINLRWRDGDALAACRKSNEQEGREDEIATTMRALAAKYFGTPVLTKPPEIPDSLKDPIVDMCDLSCWLRTPVHRDQFNHQIDDVGARERPTRLNKAIRMVLAGHGALQARSLTNFDLTLAYRLAMDSAPARKVQIVDSLEDGVELNTSEVSEVSGLPRTSVIRELQELEALQIVRLSKIDDEGDKRTLAVLTDRFSDMREKVLKPILPA